MDNNNLAKFIAFSEYYHQDKMKKSWLYRLWWYKVLVVNWLGKLKDKLWNLLLVGK